VLTLALLVGLATGAAAQTPGAGEQAPVTPGSELRVWLVTMGPGQAVWERFGHNAIRVLDTRTGRDVSYNWGIFDFNQVDFIPRFLRGEMLYMMAAFSTGPMIEAYARSGREVVFQELDLTDAEKAGLYELAEVNALPENREYRYDYFVDNCSTRVRDLLDRVTHGLISERFRGEPGTTYRWHTRRLTRVDVPLFTGMDLLLGPPGDEPIAVWDEMFVPMVLRDAVRKLSRVAPDGVEKPLVVAEEVVVVAAEGNEEPQVPPHWLPYYLLVGLGLGGLLAGAGARLGRGPSRLAAAVLATAGGLWSLLAGIAGVLLVAVLFTEHWAMRWNTSLFLFNPIHLALVVLVPLAAWGRACGRAERVARLALWITAVGAGVSLLPIQQNGIFVAWALPTQAGLWWGLRTLYLAGAGDGERR
jgi:hypothetical protein